MDNFSNYSSEAVEKAIRAGHLPRHTLSDALTELHDLTLPEDLKDVLYKLDVRDIETELKEITRITPLNYIKRIPQAGTIVEKGPFFRFGFFTENGANIASKIYTMIAKDAVSWISDNTDFKDSNMKFALMGSVPKQTATFPISINLVQDFFNNGLIPEFSSVSTVSDIDLILLTNKRSRMMFTDFPTVMKERLRYINRSLPKAIRFDSSIMVALANEARFRNSGEIIEILE